MNIDRREHQRENCGSNYIVTYRTDNVKIECGLNNLSITGACIESSFNLTNGEKIILHICDKRDTPVKGTVVWTNGDVYGIQFELNSSEEFENISFIMNNRNWD